MRNLKASRHRWRQKCLKSNHFPESNEVQTRCLDFLSDVAVSRKRGQGARCDRRSSQVAELLDSLTEGERRCRCTRQLEDSEAHLDNYQIPPPFLILTCVCNLKIYSPPDLALNIEDERALSYLATCRTCYLIRGNTSHRREGVDKARKKWNTNARGAKFRIIWVW